MQYLISNRNKLHRVLALSSVILMNLMVYTDCTGPASNYTGFLLIRPINSPKRFFVYCDIGWVVIQRRFDGTVSFYKSWAEYKEGFGDLDGEMWLGNDNIHYITQQAQYKLQYTMERWVGGVNWASHDYFSIGDESHNYKINVSISQVTNKGISIEGINGQEFTTHDRDNDDRLDGNCGRQHEAGWWFKNCAKVNLNSFYPANGICPQGSDLVCFKNFNSVPNVKLLKASIMKMKKMN